MNGSNPDRLQNLMDYFLAQDTHLLKVSCKSVDYFVSNPAYGQTNKKIDKQRN